MGEREKRLMELKVRLDAVHETVLHALKIHDEEAMDRAMEEQQSILEEYRTISKLQPT